MENKRAAGFYFVRLRERWIVAEWVYVPAIASYWEMIGSIDIFKDNDFDEIDETPIVREGWISVKDELPDTNEDVLVATIGGVFCYTHNFFPKRGWIPYGMNTITEGVTHWMPLPGIPKKQTNE